MTLPQLTRVTLLHLFPTALSTPYSPLWGPPSFRTHKGCQETNHHGISSTILWWGPQPSRQALFWKTMACLNKHRATMLKSSYSICKTCTRIQKRGLSDSSKANQHSSKEKITLRWLTFGLSNQRSLSRTSKCWKKLTLEALSGSSTNSYSDRFSKRVKGFSLCSLSPSVSLRLPKWFASLTCTLKNLMVLRSDHCTRSLSFRTSPRFSSSHPLSKCGTKLLAPICYTPQSISWRTSR